MAKYDIKGLRQQEAEFERKVQTHFFEFFKAHDYMSPTPQVVTYKIDEQADIDKTYSGRGFYLILTDYPTENNKCTCKVGGLTVVYRGHCSVVKKRIQSHLSNTLYRANLPERGVRYDVCMNIDGQQGINITQDPYKKYRWSVMVHKMPKSSKAIREQAELAFDDVFSRPVGSREKRTKKV
jgi:hypothetical protein